MYAQPVPIVKTEAEEKTQSRADAPESILKVRKSPNISQNEAVTAVELNQVTHQENGVPSLAEVLALGLGLPMF